MNRAKHSPDRLLVLARRARFIAKNNSGLIADLYREHAAICEWKAATQRPRRIRARRPTKDPI